MKKAVSLRMDPVNVGRVAEIARALGKSQSEVIEWAVELAWAIYGAGDEAERVRYEAERFSREMRERVTHT